ncbi:MAG: APC family permease [Pseudomonadota bacterium]
MTDTALRRRIGLPLLTAYGVGVMVGAGIYVLVGLVAAEAGVWAPAAFLVAGAIALPTALSYAEFSTRIPEAAGEAAYVEKGLASPALGTAIGLAIVVVGAISAAAVLRGGVGYLIGLVDIPAALAIVALGALLTFVALVGVLESMAFAAVLTAVELVGLALVIWAGATAAPVEAWTAPPPIPLLPVAAAAVLAFFAFIGFEDIVNMAEETDKPTVTLPRAIILSMVITTLIYIAVAAAAVRAVPADQLGASEQPLALVLGTGAGALTLSAIAATAALNGVLAQIVMAARVLFGLGRRRPWLARFHTVHPRFGTPAVATLLLGTVVVLGALTLPVARLAEVASTLLLIVFAVVNAALLVLKSREPEAPFRVPGMVPILGLVLSLAALGLSLSGVA